MPLYTVRCQTCGKEGSLRLSFAGYTEVQEGKRAIYCPCEGKAEIVFSPGGVNFILRDGPSGGWISKASKENAYRANRRLVMEKRERDHVFKSRLQPNFQGQLTSDWKEAREAAFQGTYDSVKEKHGPEVARQAATESAKTYDPLVNQQVGR